jgi:hypothetical protein
MRTENPAALNAAAVGAPPRLPIAVLAMNNPVSKGKAVVPAQAGTQSTARRSWAPAFAGATSNGIARFLFPVCVPAWRGDTGEASHSVSCLFSGRAPLYRAPRYQPQRRGAPP